MPRHFLLCEIVGKGHERAQGLYKCSLISGMLPCLFQEMKIITLLSSVRAWKNILGPGRVKRNTVRYSGKRKIACRVKSLTGKRDSQKPRSGMREPWSGMRDRDDRSSGSGEIWRDAIFGSQPLISYLASERHVVNMGLLDMMPTKF